MSAEHAHPAAQSIPPVPVARAVLDAALVERAVAHLSAADLLLGQAIAAAGPWRLPVQPDLFLALVEAICSQQISVAAADTIYNRLLALAPPGATLHPHDLAAASDEHLRAAGCSRAKVAALRDLSAHFLDGRLEPDRLRHEPDDRVVEALVGVRGIGRWTAEMALIFALGRPDVLPADDLGIVVAFQAVYDLPSRPSRAAILAHGERWRPFRTIASWYLWQSRRVVLGRPW